MLNFPIVGKEWSEEDHPRDESGRFAGDGENDLRTGTNQPGDIGPGGRVYEGHLNEALHSWKGWPSNLVGEVIRGVPADQSSLSGRNMRAQAEALVDAVSNAPVVDKTLWRGISLAKDKAELWTPGTVMGGRDLSSFTESKAIGRNFALERGAQDRVLIQLEPGASALRINDHISDPTSEGEYIVGGQLTVTEHTTEETKPYAHKDPITTHYITVRQTEPLTARKEFDEAAHPRDERGRFASDGSATATAEAPIGKPSYADGRPYYRGSPDVVLAVERPAFKEGLAKYLPSLAGRPDDANERSVTLQADGTPVVDKIGGPTEVNFTHEETLQMREGLLMHSHPDDMGPGPTDIEYAARINAAAIIATHGDGAWVIEPESTSTTENRWTGNAGWIANELWSQTRQPVIAWAKEHLGTDDVHELQRLGQDRQSEIGKQINIAWTEEYMRRIDETAELRAYRIDVKAEPQAAEPATASASKADSVRIPLPHAFDDDEKVRADVEAIRRKLDSWGITGAKSVLDLLRGKAGDFDEEKHPRDEAGRFAVTEGEPLNDGEAREAGRLNAEAYYSQYKYPAGAAAWIENPVAKYMPDDAGYKLIPVEVPWVGKAAEDPRFQQTMRDRIDISALEGDAEKNELWAKSRAIEDGMEFAQQARDDWSLGARITEMVAFQRDAADELGLSARDPNPLVQVAPGQPLAPLHQESSLAIEEKDNGAANRALAREIYEQTQASLKEAGIKEVTLYRGMSWEPPPMHVTLVPDYQTDLPEWAANADPGDRLDVQSEGMNPLSSWSSDPDKAMGFATGRGYGMVIEARVPAEAIFSTPQTGFGAPSEKEWVVLAHDNDTAKVTEGGLYDWHKGEFMSREEADKLGAAVQAMRGPQEAKAAKPKIILDDTIENIDWIRHPSVRAAKDFDEDLHPRDDAGRFTSGIDAPYHEGYVSVPADAAPPGDEPGVNLHVTTAGTGVPVRGVVIAWDDPRIPDKLYHVTTNADAVEQTGVLYAGGVGGLGGDRRDEVVSMSISKEIAESIADDLKLSVEVAHNNGDDAAINAILLERAQADGWGEQFKEIMRGPEVRYNATDHLRQYFNYREDHVPERPNPLIFSTPEDLNRQPIGQIGIVEIPKASLNNGALLTDFDAFHGAWPDTPVNPKHSLGEIRSYGDVQVGDVKKIKARNIFDLLRGKEFDPDQERDEHGRWTSGGGSDGASAPITPDAPVVRQAMAEVATQGTGNERGIAFTADGRRLVDRIGDARQVTFTPEEIKELKGGIVVHSHPVSEYPSTTDISLALRVGLDAVVSVKGDSAWIVEREGATLRAGEEVGRAITEMRFAEQAAMDAALAEAVKDPEILAAARAFNATGPNPSWLKDEMVANYLNALDEDHPTYQRIDEARSRDFMARVDAMASLEAKRVPVEKLAAAVGAKGRTPEGPTIKLVAVRPFAPQAEKDAVLDRLLEQLDAALGEKAFDPEQERDEQGRWTSGGGGSVAEEDYALGLPPSRTSELDQMIEAMSQQPEVAASINAEHTTTRAPNPLRQSGVRENIRQAMAVLGTRGDMTERGIRLDREGNVVIDKEGTEPTDEERARGILGSVSYTPEEAEAGRGGVDVHSHPGQWGHSSQDILFAAAFQSAASITVHGDEAWVVRPKYLDSEGNPDWHMRELVYDGEAAFKQAMQETALKYGSASPSERVDRLANRFIVDRTLGIIEDKGYLAYDKVTVPTEAEALPPAKLSGEKGSGNITVREWGWKADLNEVQRDNDRLLREIAGIGAKSIFDLLRGKDWDEEQHPRDGSGRFASSSTEEAPLVINTGRSASQIALKEKFIDDIYAKGHVSPIDPHLAAFETTGGGFAQLTLEPGFDKNEVRIDWLAAMERGTGAGGEVLRSVTDLADARGITLSLVAMPTTTAAADTKMSTRNLISYYKGFGFESDTRYRDPAYMIRHPASEKAFDPEQPRDEAGRWTSDGSSADGSEHMHTEGGRPVGPFREVQTATEALEAIARGEYVSLPPNQLGTLLDKMYENAKEAERLGKEAPKYDLCQVSVPDTNIFCEESLGIPRVQMPQIPDVKDFKEHLFSLGYGMTQENVYADKLKATQGELDGVKVGSIMSATREGKFNRAAEPLFVSSDNFVIDGHHRWAAAVGLDYAADAKGGGVEMEVIKVDLPITALLPIANAYSDAAGVPREGFGAKVLRWLRGRTKERAFDETQPRDEHGRWTSGGEAFQAVLTERERKNGQAFMAERGITTRKIGGRLARLRDRASPATVREGKGWYRATNRFAGKLSTQYGVDRDVAVGVIAALSPQVEWTDAKRGEINYANSNQDQADRVLAIISDADRTMMTIDPGAAQMSYERDLASGQDERRNNAVDAANYNGIDESKHGMDFTGREVRVSEVPSDLVAIFHPEAEGMMRGNAVRAFEIARGADPDEVLGGDKVRAFYNNITHPESDDVTLDVHMVRAMLDDPTLSDYGYSHMVDTPGKYEFLAEAVRTAAAREDMTPMQLQATVWLQWREEHSATERRLSTISKELDAELWPTNDALAIIADDDMVRRYTVLRRTKGRTWWGLLRGKASDWDEEKHPRDATGKFTDGGALTPFPAALPLLPDRTSWAGYIKADTDTARSIWRARFGEEPSARRTQQLANVLTRTINERVQPRTGLAYDEIAAAVREIGTLAGLEYPTPPSEPPRETSAQPSLLEPIPSIGRGEETTDMYAATQAMERTLGRSLTEDEISAVVARWDNLREGEPDRAISPRELEAALIVRGVEMPPYPLPGVDTGLIGSSPAREPSDGQQNPLFDTTQYLAPADPIVREHFTGKDTEIIISGPDEVNAREQSIGINVEDHEWAQLIGAPDGSKVEVTPTYGGGGSSDITGESIRVGATNSDLNVVQTRYIGKDDQGTPVIYNAYMSIGDSAPAGIATHMIAMEVAKAEDLGIERIEVHAAGSEGSSMNGYYTWPRMGFNADLPEDFRERLPATLKDATTFNEIMGDPDGREAWKQDGSEVTLYMDIDKGSSSRAVLNAYLAEKGYTAPDPDAQPAKADVTLVGESARKEQGRVLNMAEEFPWTAEDEAAADRAWARIAATKDFDEESHPRDAYGRFTHDSDSAEAWAANPHGQKAAALEREHPEYFHSELPAGESFLLPNGKFFNVEWQPSTSRSQAIYSTHSALAERLDYEARDGHRENAAIADGLVRVQTSNLDRHDEGARPEINIEARSQADALRVLDPSNMPPNVTNNTRVFVDISHEVNDVIRRAGSGSYDHLIDAREALKPLGVAAKAWRWLRNLRGRAKDFDEERHPRDTHGRFSDVSGGELGLSGGAAGRLDKQLESKGGFTYNVWGKNAPKVGMVLSINPSREQTHPRSAPPTIEDFRAYVEKNRDLLSSPGKNVGGWREDDGSVTLDVSTIVDTHEEAKALAEKYHQRAYFDLSTGKTHRADEGWKARRFLFADLARRIGRRDRSLPSVPDRRRAADEAGRAGVLAERAKQAPRALIDDGDFWRELGRYATRRMYPVYEQLYMGGMLAALKIARVEQRKAWNEEDHPRDERGRFGEGGGAVAVAERPPAAPIELPADVPGMQTWLQERYPKTTFDLDAGNPEVMGRVVTQFAELADRYPNVRVNEVKVVEGLPAGTVASVSMAYLDMKLSAGLFRGDAGEFERGLQGQHAAGVNTIEGVITHEFGHLVDFQMGQDTLPMAQLDPKMLTDLGIKVEVWPQEKVDTVREKYQAVFGKEGEDPYYGGTYGRAAQVSRYANDSVRDSSYDEHDPGRSGLSEAFAEAFAASWHGTGAVTQYERDAVALMDELGYPTRAR